MADDFYVSGGLNTPRMAKVASKYRQEFEIVAVETVDIINILEFKLPEMIPEFRLLVVEDSELESSAQAVTDPPSILVRETIYQAACEGDSDSRFILAHELGHILLHRGKASRMHRSTTGYKPQFRNMKSMESAEEQANMFARHFLIPPWLAHQFRDDPKLLSEISRTPLSLARGSISIAKRVEMLTLTQAPLENSEHVVAVENQKNSEAAIEVEAHHDTAQSSFDFGPEYALVQASGANSFYSKPHPVNSELCRHASRTKVVRDSVQLVLPHLVHLGEPSCIDELQPSRR